ncbi:MAG TPA: flavin-nucleotide-binding protein [Elusimicrobia bacterium]|nr:MAG: hypothetical protein A2X37_06680 [Elusimicrobia bacterium GWA2_66_18]OGR69805.1 MAG: hypothetical protein A2X40_01840 [Elusimicrobia bacterium GWC2_65_9]HAZ08311.1 flavin-nucleotide-binding protein [Elusimicrobiota bacterium]
MRRKEFEVFDECDLERVLDAADWGVLGLLGKTGRPLLVPLNFTRLGRSLYFHSAPAGEKIDALRRGKAATFVAVRPLALVPSYFFDEARACGATSFFESVVVKGRARLVGELEEKARALQALMVKLQPEGKHEPIRAGSPLYRAALRGVAVIALDIETMTGKFKVGQNMPAAKRARLRRRLLARGRPLDRETARAMRRG